MIRGRKPGLDLTTIAIQLRSYLAMAGIYEADITSPLRVLMLVIDSVKNGKPNPNCAELSISVHRETVEWAVSD